MNEEQAAQILRESYNEAAARREQALSIHLFGIRYAGELAALSIPEILAKAGIPASYGTEIRKGMKLAQHVVLRD
ncbi:HTH-like domain-containing protein [Pannonibacter phragmitetus]|uniref:HTH-like domain-containing protein n=1 Tax=Pannonibacter phragmitetus TaxID=121719 RepID=A0A0U3PNL2_9HYPH|nr:hypothetical protein [Pannonibacter phragmitetus]ALV29100.1 hypothetical protein APZ00_20335 [Pannonibacter phragmitetus]